MSQARLAWARKNVPLLKVTNLHKELFSEDVIWWFGPRSLFLEGPERFFTPEKP